MSTLPPTVLGSIVSLWRYPVKSMLGEELNAAAVTERGLLGDRAVAGRGAGAPRVPAICQGRGAAA